MISSYYVVQAFEDPSWMRCSMDVISTIPPTTKASHAPKLKALRSIPTNPKLPFPICMHCPYTIAMHSGHRFTALPCRPSSSAHATRIRPGWVRGEQLLTLTWSLFGPCLYGGCPRTHIEKLHGVLADEYKVVFAKCP